MFKKVLAIVIIVGISLVFAQIQNVKPLKAAPKAVAAPVQAKKADSKVAFKLAKVVPETTKVVECDSVFFIKYDSVKVATLTRDTTLTKDTTVHDYKIDTVKTSKTAKVKK
jgi:hypothetical protein